MFKEENRQHKNLMFLDEPMILDDVLSEEDCIDFYRDAICTEKWGYNLSYNHIGLYDNVPSDGSKSWRWTFFNDKTQYFGDDTPQWVLDLIPYLDKTLQLNLSDMTVMSAQFNGQTKGQDSGWHKDYTLSVMVMLNHKWNKNWGGDFEYRTTDGEVKAIEFKPGRVIIFDGNNSHRGMAPKIENVLRITMAIHLYDNTSL